MGDDSHEIAVAGCRALHSPDPKFMRGTHDLFGYRIDDTGVKARKNLLRN